MCLQICMMGKLMDLNLDKRNIIKFFGWFNRADEKVLVFEWFGVGLGEFCEQVSPIPLSAIRAIIQQV